MTAKTNPAEETGTKHFVGFVAPALIQHPGLSSTDKTVAIALLMHRNRESGLCYATQDTLSLELGTNERTIQRSIATLKSLGLVGAESRKAPRGYAKGRANLYDLSSLIDLCFQPILNAKEIAKRKKADSEAGKATPVSSHASDFRTASTDKRGDKNDVHDLSSREVTPVSSHASDFRAKEQNSNSYTCNSSSPSGSPSSKESSTSNCADSVEYGACSERREKGEATPVSSHSAQITQGIDPEGRPYGPDSDAWASAEHAIKRAGGEPFNHGVLANLVDTFGPERVWFHAEWFLRRLASLKTPPDKPAPYFIKCVTENYPVSQDWPKFCRSIHGVLTDDELAALPDGNDPKDWVAWVASSDNLMIDDVPRIPRTVINDAKGASWVWEPILKGVAERSKDDSFRIWLSGQPKEPAVVGADDDCIPF